MKKFGGFIIKTFLYQIVMSFFGIMLYSALQSNDLLKSIAMALGPISFWTVLYVQTSDFGTKSAEKDMSHSENTSPFLAFLFSLAAFIPTALMSVISMILKPSLGGAGYVSFILNKLLLQGMTVGVASRIYPTSVENSEIENALAMDSQSTVFLIFALLSVAVCGISFVIGYKKFGHEKRSNS